MILGIDVSNSGIAVAAMEDGEILYTGRLSTDKGRSFDEYAILMDVLFKRHNIDLTEAEGAILSSVVPELTETIRKASNELIGADTVVVGPGVKTGLNIRLDDPAELASDFVAVAVAAKDRYPLPCVIVNMDTAVAIGVLDEQGNYIGGVIAAGVMASQIALSRGASQLHAVSPTAPGQVIGRNTVDSMRSGIIYGTAAMLDGLLTGIDEQLGQTATVVATGQWADSVVPHCRRPNIIRDPSLTMRGLWLIYQRRVKKQAKY